MLHTSKRFTAFDSHSKLSATISETCETIQNAYKAIFTESKAYSDVTINAV